MYAKDRVNASGRFFNTPAEKLRLFDQNCQGWQWFHTVVMFCARTKLAFNCCTWTYNS